MIAAGKYDQRVTFQQKGVTKNAIGEEVVTWSDVVTLWAEVVPLRGGEFYAANQTQQSVDVRFRIRARTRPDQRHAPAVEIGSLRHHGADPRHRKMAGDDRDHGNQRGAQWPLMASPSRSMVSTS